MPDLVTVAAFTSTTLLLLLIPGPTVLFVVSRTVQLGLRPGLVGALGVECGSLLHAGAATVGLSALVARSDTTFTLVKYAGVAYLVCLGWRQLRSNDHGAEKSSARSSTSAGASFIQGLVVEVLNPKTALFFLAFLPQFVDPLAGRVTLQIGILGGLFVALALAVDASFAVLASGIGRHLTGSMRARRVDQASGLILFGLAAVAVGA